MWSMIKHLGPGLILAAVVLGPGSITLATIAGSLYGYSLLWVVVVATFFMIVYTRMAARIGVVGGMTLFEATRFKYGRAVARIGGLFSYLAILSFQAGNTAAVGFSGNAILGSDARLWSAAFVGGATAFLFVPRLYPKLELLVKVVVGLMVLGFVGTLSVVGVNGGQLVRGLLPGFPDESSLFLALGMLATTFSIAAAAYQNHLVKEKGWKVKDLSSEGLDTILGIGLLGAITAVVLCTSAAVLSGSSGKVFSAQVMAVQLEPLAGPGAFYLFNVGFFFAAFSSLVVNPILGATLLVDSYEGNTSIDGRAVKLWTVVALLAGLGVVLIFKGSPIELLRTAQAASIVAFPVLAFLLWSVARDRSLLGEHANGRWVDLLAALGYAAVIGIVVNFARQILETFA